MGFGGEKFFSQLGSTPWQVEHRLSVRTGEKEAPCVFREEGEKGQKDPPEERQAFLPNHRKTVCLTS